MCGLYDPPRPHQRIRIAEENIFREVHSLEHTAIAPAWAGTDTRSARELTGTGTGTDSPLNKTPEDQQYSTPSPSLSCQQSGFSTALPPTSSIFRVAAPFIVRVSGRGVLAD